MLQSNRSSPRRPTRRSRRDRRRYAIDVTAPPPRAVAHTDDPDGDGDRVARDRRLFARHRDGTGAPTDRDDVVVRFLPLARHLAARYARPPEPFEDVYQVACMALVKAVDRYDADRE